MPLPNSNCRRRYSGARACPPITIAWQVAALHRGRNGTPGALMQRGRDFPRASRSYQGEQASRRPAFGTVRWAYEPHSPRLARPPTEHPTERLFSGGLAHDRCFSYIRGRFCPVSPGSIAGLSNGRAAAPPIRDCGYHMTHPWVARAECRTAFWALPLDRMQKRGHVSDNSTRFRRAQRNSSAAPQLI